MTIWDENNLQYLLFIFDVAIIRDFKKLTSLIFLLNYYNLLENGKTFFQYKFIKDSNSIKAINLDEDIDEIILYNLVTVKNFGIFSITELGKDILSRFNVDFSSFNNILQSILAFDYNKKVSEFVLIQKAKDKQEISI